MCSSDLGCLTNGERFWGKGKNQGGKLGKTYKVFPRVCYMCKFRRNFALLGAAIRAYILAISQDQNFFFDFYEHTILLLTLKKKTYNLNKPDLTLIEIAQKSKKKLRRKEFSRRIRKYVEMQKRKFIMEKIDLEFFSTSLCAFEGEKK